MLKSNMVDVSEVGPSPYSSPIRYDTEDEPMLITLILNLVKSSRGLGHDPGCIAIYKEALAHGLQFVRY